LTDFAEHLGVQPRTHHAAQFYEDESFLVEAMARFGRAGLRAGDGLIVIATRPHLEALTERLESPELRQGLDTGRVVFFDARETLSRFMVAGAPDPDRFRACVGSSLDACKRASLSRGLPASQPPRIRAVGEMVDLLCGEGNSAAAVRLEEYWGEVCEEQSVSLLCAYAMKHFSREEDAERFEEVCDLHDRVLPAEGYGRSDDPIARHREIAVLQQRARALVLEVEKRKELERALRHAMGEQRQAEHASHVRNELLATVAHELRLPLKAIVGWASLLRSGHGVDVLEAAETIELSAQAQGRLLEDVTDASRVLGGTLRIRPGPVDLAFVLRASVEAVAPSAMTKGITIDVSIDSDPCLGHADVHRVEQVLSTLLSNAVQFTPEGGRVDVGLRREGERVEFTIRDNGCGIPASTLPYIFDRLRRVEGGAARRATGMRFGLAVARHLVELHGGSMEAQSEGTGRGSTFTIRLPRRATLCDAGTPP
jgi:signal transduction histidine kinase